MLNRKRIFVIASLLLSANQLAAAETLRDVLSRTVLTNPDVRVSAKVRNASNEGVKQARAGYFPTIDVNAGFGREQGDNVNTSFSSSTLWRRDLGFTAKQMVFDGYATRYEVVRNKAKTNADAYKVNGTAQDTALLAAQAYLDVLRNQALVRVAKKNVAAHRSTFSIIRRMSEQGLGREADTDQTSGRLDLARANLVTAINNLESARITFQKITGCDPYHLTRPPHVPRSLLPNSESDAVARAINNHPILKSANADIAEARGQMQASKSKFYPRLDLVVSARRNRNVAGVEGPDYDTLGMLQLQYNIFQGGKDIARTRETSFNLEESFEIRNRTYRQVVESMKLSWTAYENAQARIPFLIGHKRKSISTTHAYQKQFELGKRTILDVLDSQNELYTSEQDLINERFALLFAEYRILNGMGILLDFFQVPLPVEAIVPFCEKELC